MEQGLQIYNSLHREYELCQPMTPPRVGLYVCGPTVYGEPHLGHARPAVTFDILFRYLKHLGYKVRYVRNITDVGHLENDADTGEDKIGKKARLEQLEPMEVVQQYTNSYHDHMALLNTLPPSIEPRATGHILEQQMMVKAILEKGFAYESNGSVYFDVKKYNEQHDYGILSGRKLEDLKSESRELEKQSDKKNPYDFAIWKKADPEHIMRWPSEWGEGFPGWHLECSVMSTRYLGEEFDIHGGGMDLKFPHHECEIAQSKAVLGKDSVKYWMHNNMITINGQKMGKSLGNFITLHEFFTGGHELLEKAYSPMTVRFFMLQAHYRAPLDFSNKALEAAEKGLERLFNGMENLEKIQPGDQSSIQVAAMEKDFYKAMNDDLNTPVLLAHVFDGIKKINLAAEGKESLTGEDLEKLKKLYAKFVHDILGLEKETQKEAGLSAELVEMILQIRLQAKAEKNFALSDKIRDELNAKGIEVKDKKGGFDWKFK
jgi:cysteinyl-tRNA synthetase